ncbi:glycosyltransferase family 4 protein [Candidatus Bipolaricaulota bacterium]
MRVLVFMTQFYQLGGAERLAVELAEELNQRGIRADILSMYGKDLAGAAEGNQMLYDRGIPAAHSLDMRVHPSVASIVPAMLRLRRLISRERYDVVETSMVLPTLLAAWAVMGTRTRHVAGVHDVFSRDRYNTLKDRFLRLSLRLRRKTRYYAISDYAAKHWLEYIGAQKVRIRTLYNGIPNDCFGVVPERDDVRDEFAIPRSARIALFVGRMLKRKGIDTILAALGPILGEEDLYLLYVGGIDQPPELFFPDEVGLIDRLHAQLDREGWADRVRFLGRRNDVPRLMAASDVLVHPARIEGFGLVLAEALAAGLPVVASNAQGIPEVLSGTHSIMVPPDDPLALQKAVLSTLHRAPSDAALAVEVGRKRAEAFRIEHRIDAMDALLRDVVAGRF